MSSSLTCLNLPVFTKSGAYLGRIVDVEVDASAHQVVYFQVKPPPLGLSLVGRRHLLISPHQVINIAPDKMVVQDTTVSDKEVVGNLAIEPAP